MATVDQRTHALAIMEWLIAEHHLIGYQQLRPMATASLYEQPLATAFGNATGGPLISPDCSEMVTMICRMSGFQDPSGMKYDGYGNSVTMYNHLPHFTQPINAHTGSIVAFGPSGDIHVAMVMVQGHDPLLFSHGSSIGPIQVSLSDLVASYGTPAPEVTFLSVGSL